MHLGTPLDLRCKLPQDCPIASLLALISNRFHFLPASRAPPHFHGRPIPAFGFHNHPSSPNKRRCSRPPAVEEVPVVLRPMRAQAPPLPDAADVPNHCAVALAVEVSCSFARGFEGGAWAWDRTRLMLKSRPRRRRPRRRTQVSILTDTTRRYA